MGMLRLILALTILLGHVYAILGINNDLSTFEFVGSATAFQSFFIVSGFTIAMILNHKYPVGMNGYKLFISNRFYRIYPIYYACLAFTIIVCLAHLGFNGDALLMQPLIDYFSDLDLGAKAFVIASNLSIIGQEAIFFLKINQDTGSLILTSEDFRFVSLPQVHQFIMISQAWAISFILIFYVIAPFVVRRSGFILLLFLASIALRFGLYIADPEVYYNEPWIYRFFPFELGMFLMGVISYRMLSFLLKVKFNQTASLLLSGLFILLSVLYKFIPIQELIYNVLPDSLRQVGGWTPVEFYVKQWIYYLLLCLSMPFLFHSFRSVKWDRWLGELSIPVYLSHFVIIHWIGSMESIPLNSKPWIIILTVFIVSILIMYLIMRPLENWRKTRSSHLTLNL